MLGGLVLLCLIAVTCLSILGRSANTIGHGDWLAASFPALAGWLVKLGPINGDFEIVEAGVAFAIFAFLPWCTIERGHATVDLFTSKLPDRANQVLALLWDIVYAGVMIVITWRLYEGTQNKIRYGETSFMLEYPIWWGFAACTVAAAITCVVCIYRLITHPD